ncbi:hypothetical protein GCM10009681_04650 [Luedemannella helvata]|uniref:Uncharacterized protein n=1 Tax=Luedemannella helvata TaxID=349315 RepID=A0ABP4VW25_9ACTN
MQPVAQKTWFGSFDSQQLALRPARRNRTMVNARDVTIRVTRDELASRTCCSGRLDSIRFPNMANLTMPGYRSMDMPSVDASRETGTRAERHFYS